jgi:hypothetical protein
MEENPYESPKTTDLPSETAGWSAVQLWTFRILLVVLMIEILLPFLAYLFLRNMVFL